MIRTRRIFHVIAYLVSLIAYAIVIYLYNDEGYELVGAVNVVLLICSDLLIYVYRRHSGTSSVWLIENDQFKVLLLLVIRALLCFFMEYWLIMEASVFFIVTTIVAVYLVNKMVQKNVELETDDPTCLYYLSPALKAYVSENIKELTFEYTDIENQERYAEAHFIRRHATLILWVGYFFIFLIICAASSLEID